MPEYKVEIRVQDDRRTPGYGSMSYTWSALHAAPGDTVVWISRQGPFKIVFLERSPFAGNRHSVSSRESAEGFTTETVTVGQDADVFGTYYYAVAVAAKNDIFLDAACPSVVIE